MKRLAPERLSEIQAVFEQSTNSMYISQQVHLFDVQQAHCCKHVLPSNAALCVDSAKHNLWQSHDIIMQSTCTHHNILWSCWYLKLALPQAWWSEDIRPAVNHCKTSEQQWQTQRALIRLCNTVLNDMSMKSALWMQVCNEAIQSEWDLGCWRIQELLWTWHENFNIISYVRDLKPHSNSNQCKQIRKSNSTYIIRLQQTWTHFSPCSWLCLLALQSKSFDDTAY